MRLSTRQGLRPPRHLGGQKMYTTLLPFGPRAPSLPRMSQPPMLPALLKRPCPRILPFLAIFRKEKSRPRSRKPLRKPSPRWQSPLITSKDGVGSQGYELVLATLPIPTKEDPKGKEGISSTEANTQPAKDKLVIKMKP